MTEVSISAGRGPGDRAGLLDHPRTLCVKHCGERNKTASTKDSATRDRAINYIAGSACTREMASSGVYCFGLWRGPG